MAANMHLVASLERSPRRYSKWSAVLLPFRSGQPPSAAIGCMGARQQSAPSRMGMFRFIVIVFTLISVLEVPCEGNYALFSDVVPSHGLVDRRGVQRAPTGNGNVIRERRSNHRVRRPVAQHCVFLKVSPVPLGCADGLARAHTRRIEVEHLAGAPGPDSVIHQRG